ncbi:MAG TPA: anti-sigma-D factor RsdA [Pseudonocardiaceae bacterium]|nr:anti-sigma-D factor RsdA [Pseudonocardiaceae bacterium]
MAGWDEHPQAGYPHGDPYEMPADLAALQADDALLDLIGSGGHIPSDTDDELTRMLSAWRREVHAEPVRQLVDTRTAMSVIRAAARRPARRRNPVYGSVAAAAAVLVIAFSGVGLVAKSAQPGDQLWGVTQVLYSDYARSVETAAAVRTELNEAKVALNQGHPEQARATLAHVQQQLPAVGESEGHTDLSALHRQLEQRLNEPSPGTAQPKPPESPAAGPLTPGSTEPDTTKAGSPSSEPPSTSGSITMTPGPTTTPGRTDEMPADTPSSPNQFMPGRDYRHYRSGATAPGSGSQNSSSTGAGQPGFPGNDGTAKGGPNGASAGVDSSAPGTQPDGDDTAGKGPTTGNAGGPHPSNGFSTFCDHAVPKPRFCR